METRSPRHVPRATTVLLLLWLAFVERGFWYGAMLPPWEGYDEPFYFSALQQVASGHGLPRSDSRITLEVQKSLHLLPLAWELQKQSIPQPLTPHDEFWKLPPSEQQRRIDAVRVLPAEDGSQFATEPIPNYESQQVPLYFWLFALPMRWMSSLSLLSRVYLLRFLCLLLASMAVPLAYWIERRVLRNELQALGVTAVIVLLPELMIDMARVGNESLSLVCYTAMLAGAVLAAQRPLWWRGWLLLGLSLGCGLLAKAFILSAVPPVVALAAVVGWLPGSDSEPKPRLAPVAARCGAALMVAALIAGRWYGKVHSATGSWTGVKDDVALSQLSLLQKLAAVPQVNWKSGALSILISHVWFGAWSFLQVLHALYVLALVVIAVAVAGVLFRLRRRRATPAEMRDIVALAAFYLCFWAGLAYSVLIDYLRLGVSASAGWYLYATVAAEMVLLVWGLQAFVRARFLFPVLAMGVAALDLYGMHALLMPYFTGLTAHVGNSVPPAFWSTLAHLPVVFDRLAVLRPAWLSAPVLLSWWIGYWVATLGTVFAVVLPFRSSSAEA